MRSTAELAPGFSSTEIFQRKKPSVLIVDDRPEGLLSLEAVLSSGSQDFEIIKASSGYSAIELAGAIDFAVILLDVQMPRMDGFETAQHIRQIRQHVPIIFITAISHDDTHVFRGYDSGAVDYLFKPLNASILKSKVAVFIDLFQRSQALEEASFLLREFERRAHEQRYKNLADAIPHLVVRTDVDGEATYFNKGWFTYTGLSEAESLRQGWHSVCNSADLAVLLGEWDKSKAREVPCEVEARFRSARIYGERWHLVRGVPEKDKDGPVAGWVFTCTEIHDRKQAEIKTREQAEALEQSNRDLEQFAYIASHDLQEPLRKITNYVDLLQLYTKGQLNDRAQKCMAPILTGAKRMQQLITDLLNYSRVAKGESGPRGPVNVELVISAVLDAMGHVANSEVVVQMLPWVRGDAVQISQLFQNLISNAMKFSGSEPPRVVIGAERKNEEWIFFVKDNGIGIPEDYQAKIFEIFQRLHNQQQYPGTGIGLAICKKVIESHGGRIWVESDVGKGSAFYFTLPVIEEERVFAR